MRFLLVPAAQYTLILTIRNYGGLPGIFTSLQPDRTSFAQPVVKLRQMKMSRVEGTQALLAMHYPALKIVSSTGWLTSIFIRFNSPVACVRVKGSTIPCSSFLKLLKPKVASAS